MTWSGRGRARDAQRGFTFVELAVTVVVIGLLAAIAIPVFTGTRARATEASAQSLLRTAASAMEAASVEHEGYAPITVADLRAMEPNVAWLDTAGAEAKDDQVSISGLGATGYTLTSRADSGQTFVYAKDRTAAPTVQRSCGPGCAW
jgi:prepilin-type N-terminal cleavage/methylation domain-containing protein